MADIALNILSPIIDGTISKTVSLFKNKIVTELGLEKELNRLRLFLQLIQSVVQQAEEGQESDPAIMCWLQNLKDVAYEAVDALDECEYKVLKHKVKYRERHWIPESISFSPMFLNRMAGKIKDITEQLSYLKDLSGMINLVVSLRGQTCPTQYPKTDSFPDNSALFGREYDVATILSLLLDLRCQHSQHSVSGISIVGMAGVGKTTIAKSVYMKAKEEKLYDLVAWVCVSEDFNEQIIFGEMLRHFDRTAAPTNNMNALLEDLAKELEKKAFLLILDDVSNEDPKKWDSFSSLLKILKKMGALLWQQLAVKRSSGETLMPPDLEAIGHDIAKKCGALPLVASVMGGTLSPQADADIGRLHLLTKLDVYKCEKLASLPEDCLGHLTHLKMLKMGPFYTELEEFSGLTSIHHLHASLETLELYGWDKLKCLPHQLQHLTTLKKLALWNFNGLESLPEGLELRSFPEECLGCLTHLQELCLGPFWSELEEFPGFTSLSHLHTSLEILEISGWDKLKSLPHQLQYLTTLRKLRLLSFESLEELDHKGIEKADISPIPSVNATFSKHQLQYSLVILTADVRKLKIGAPFHGYLDDDTQTGVRMLSQPSGQGYNEFLVEKENIKSFELICFLQKTQNLKILGLWQKTLPALDSYFLEPEANFHAMETLLKKCLEIENLKWRAVAVSAPKNMNKKVLCYFNNSSTPRHLSCIHKRCMWESIIEDWINSCSGSLARSMAKNLSLAMNSNFIQPEADSFMGRKLNKRCNSLFTYCIHIIPTVKCESVLPASLQLSPLTVQLTATLGPCCPATHRSPPVELQGCYWVVSASLSPWRELQIPVGTYYSPRGWGRRQFLTLRQKSPWGSPYPPLMGMGMRRESPPPWGPLPSLNPIKLVP
ncbi:hypothetical protein SLEP1_g14682 [Rubroshorea leprosula]|uniref:Uncharacterized protein n=1 Tax=Rubroshorea leprosula TaxID=152421 RepID=A0AAV5IST2_9ROSI|nr:hypothetical protein SLEP1_g14682 [Rubroshorea leprosula]